MLERFTDRARQVIVLAQQEAGLLNHNYVGTEHILLGLVREGEGIAAQALESLGIALEVVRSHVEENIEPGQQAMRGDVPFTPRARKVLELSLRESLLVGQDHIGTEHILLGLVREGEGVAAQVLTGLGADRNRVRQQVLRLLARDPAQPRRTAAADRLRQRVLDVLAGPEGRGPSIAYAHADPPGLAEDTLAPGDVIEARLSAVEGRVGTGPETGELDRQVERIRGEMDAAAGAREYERAAELRDQEEHLLAQKAAQQQDWEARHPSLPALAEACRQLSDEVARLSALLRQQGIDPPDRTA